MDEEILPMSRDKHPQKAHHVFVEGDGDSASPTSAFCVGGSSAQQYRTHRKRAAASLSDSSDKEDVMRARRSPVSPCDGDSFTSLTTDRLATYQISSSPSCDTDLPCVDFAVRSGSGRKRKSPHNSSLDAKECFGTKPEDSPSDASQTHRLFFSTRRTVRDAVCAAFSGPPKLAPGGTPSSRLECLTQMYQNQASHWALQTGPRGSADIVKRAATILGFAEARSPCPLYCLVLFR